MDVIYTDSKGNESGVLHKFNIDFDCTDTKDFEITVGRFDSQILSGGCRWYIDGTEYGGIVDSLEVLTDSNEIKYNGRNFRSVLSKKIISPPPGRDYKTVSGSLTKITNDLLKELGLSALFICDEANIKSNTFSFDRYCTLYDGLVKLAYVNKKVIALTCHRDYVHISYMDRIDYSDEMEYCQDDIGFRIKRCYNDVNHLICLGQGELQNRQVVHIYVDGDGDIVDNQYYFGLDEITETYENTNSKDIQELKQAGIDKLGDMKDGDEFEVTSIPDIQLKIGDIVGGYEDVTGIRIKREIVNTIVTITDSTFNVEYKVGGDNPGSAGIASDLVEEYILPIATNKRLGGIKLSRQFNTDDGKLYSPAFEELKEKYIKTKLICS